MFKKFLPIIALNFVNIIGFSILIPVLPSVAELYAPSISRPVYGLLLSSYALFQFLASPILGSLSDKYGRKPLLVVSQLGTTLSWVIFGIAYFVPNIPIGPLSLPLLIIALSRVTDGITGGNISVAQAWLIDSASPEERTKAFGIIGATFGLGFLFGPVLGGISSTTSIGYLGTCILAFLISLVTLGLVKFYLPESLPKEKRDHEVHLHFWNEINLWRKLKIFKGNHFIMDLLMIRVSFAMVFAAFVTMLILFMQERFKLSPNGLGFTLSIIGIFSIINQAGVIPKLAKKLGDLKLFYISLVIFTIGLVTVPFISPDLRIGQINIGFLLFLLNSYIVNLGISSGMPTFKSILASHVSPKQQGFATGIDESLFALGNSITPTIAGILYAAIGFGTFWASGLLLILPFIVIYLRRGYLLPKEP